MNMNSDTYRKFAKAHAPRTPILKNCLRAFLVGGTIAAAGEGLFHLFNSVLALEEALSYTLVSMSIAAVAILLTAFGVFDKIGRFAGAGTLVPITGFANSVASEAIDSRAEGFVAGEGSKIFTVAGPVLLYGTLASVVFGVIYAVFCM